MNLSRRATIIASLLVVLMAPQVRAEADPLSDARIELIRENCVAAQSSMQRLELNEAVMRRNRGVGYESALKLMAALNSRIVFNKMTAPELAALTQQVAVKRNEFTQNYIAYNNSYHTTMRLPNCREQPVTFYDYLTQTRELRAKLSVTIDDIDKLLDDYQLQFNNLKQTIKKAEGSS